MRASVQLILRAITTAVQRIKRNAVAARKLKDLKTKKTSLIDEVAEFQKYREMMDWLEGWILTLFSSFFFRPETEKSLKEEFAVTTGAFKKTSKILQKIKAGIKLESDEEGNLSLK